MAHIRHLKGYNWVILLAGNPLFYAQKADFPGTEREKSQVFGFGVELNMPGMIKFTDVTIENIITADLDNPFIENILRPKTLDINIPAGFGTGMVAQAGTFLVFDVVLALLNDDNITYKKSYTMKSCWSTLFTYENLDRSSSDPIKEKFTLAVNGLNLNP